MGGMPLVSVIVPALNAGGTIRQTLDALAAQDLPREYEVIVVDDSSDDETAAMARESSAPVRVLTQPRAGPAAARNRGAAEARGAVFAFTDADCVPQPDWLSRGLEATRGADLVQGAVAPDPSVKSLPFDRTVWVNRESGLYECANLFVRRELFERLGGFEDWLRARVGKELGEDVWFGWRARRAGARIRFCGDAAVRHAVFRRSAREYVEERLRMFYFAGIVRRIPELRRNGLYGRIFLTPRSAAFDLAVVAVALAALLSTPVSLLATIPYLWLWLRGAARWRSRAPLVAPVDLAADAVTLLALAWGSARWRCPVL
jgi:glycosyltransferase involved in cell wall biosynthesis